MFAGKNLGVMYERINDPETTEACYRWAVELELSR